MYIYVCVERVRQMSKRRANDDNDDGDHERSGPKNVRMLAEIERRPQLMRWYAQQLDSIRSQLQFYPGVYMNRKETGIAILNAYPELWDPNIDPSLFDIYSRPPPHAS